MINHVLTHSSQGKKEDECWRKIARKYKFYLSFENSNCVDYISEKFWQALKYRVTDWVSWSELWKSCWCRFCQWWWEPDWRIIKLWLLLTPSFTWTISQGPAVSPSTWLSSVRTLPSTTNTFAGSDRESLRTRSSSAGCVASSTILNPPHFTLISRSGGVRPTPAPTPPGQTPGQLTL